MSSTTTDYVYDANRRLPVVLDDGTRKYVYGHGLAHATDESGNIQAVYHGDGLRSVRALTDSGANQIGLYRRDAWGVQTTAQGTSTQPFGYTGQLRDTETGLLSLRARMYDPASGRLLQRDTFGGIRRAPPSLNRYSYALNQPVNYRDPNGHCGILITVCVGAGLGAATGLVTYVIEVKSTNKEFRWTDLAVNTGAGAASGLLVGSLAFAPAIAEGGMLVNAAVGGIIGFGGETASERATGEFNPGALAGAAVGGAAGGALGGEIAGSVGSDTAKLLANNIVGRETALVGTLSGYEINQALIPAPAEVSSGRATGEGVPSKMDNAAPAS